MSVTTRTTRRRARGLLPALVAGLVAVAVAGTVPGAAGASAGSRPAGRAAVHGYVLGINDDPGHELDGPVAGATVTVVDARTGRALGSGTSDETGQYRVGGLPPRAVKVRATMTGFLPVWAANARSFRSADTYRLVAGRTLTLEGELVLWAEARISGQVLSSMDPMVHDATVTVFDARTGRVLGSARADAQGEYTVGGLPAADIKVRASAPGFLAGWASYKPYWRYADVYSLHAGQHLRQTWDERQILYLDLPIPATVRGQVLGAGAPLPYSRVTLVEAATGRILKSTVADASGHYEVQNVMAMVAFKVRATKRGWVTSYANDKRTLEEADAFVVYSGDVLDQALDPTVLRLDLSRRTR
jgi:hypothetical protein